MDEIDLEALKCLLAKVEWLDDMGPEGEGWQSDEYIAGVAALRRVIEKLEGEIYG